MTTGNAIEVKQPPKLLPVLKTTERNDQPTALIASKIGPPSTEIHKQAMSVSKEDEASASNPLPYIAKGFALIVVLLGSFGVWAATAPLDSGVVAPGVVIVSGRRQKIAHPLGGVVSEILVNEGDQVRAGEVLLRLESIRARATFDLAQGAFDAAVAEQSRLLSELDGLEQPQFPLEMWTRAAIDDNVEQILTTQTKLFAARMQSVEGERDIVDSQIEQSQNELDSVRANQASIERQQKLVVQELEGLQTLLEDGLTEKSRVLALQREHEQLRGVRAENAARIAQLKNRSNELRLVLAQREKAFNEETMARLREVQGTILEQKKTLNDAHDVLNKIEVKAPSDSVVVEMQINTPGDVVGAGQILLDLVPSTRELVIDAEVPLSDIDSVTVGQEVRITFPAFNQVTTPTLRGTIKHVSSDRIVEKTDGQTAYYRAYVSVTEQELQRLGEDRLHAGMGD